MNSRIGDYSVSLFFFLLSLYIHHESLNLGGSGPEKMPQLIAAILGISSILLFIRTLRSNVEPSEVFSGVRWKPLITLLVAWIATMLLAEEVGFFIILGIFMAVSNWAMDGRSSDRFKLLKIGSYATVTTCFLWAIFVKALNVTPPSGILF